VLTTTRLKQSPTDVLPTSLLRSSVDVFAPVISHIANLSFLQPWPVSSSLQDGTGAASAEETQPG